MKVALYARVSTNLGQDPELQLGELRELCKSRGWIISDEYVDRGVSGAKERRPALDKLLEDAHRRRFDVLLCWKLDRVGRSLRHLVNLLAELEARGIGFVALRDNVDLTTPAGRLMFQIIGAMAEFERALIQERVRAGLRLAKQRGKQLGRPKVKVDAARIASFRDSGLSRRAIQRETGIGATTLRRVAGSRAKNV
jgi:DNA invertase Pin-like site-specific DNA recombinase